MYDRGPWKDGNVSDAIVNDQKNDPGVCANVGDLDGWYGGRLIAESVAPNNKPIIKAAPDMHRLLKWALEWLALYAEPDHPHADPEFKDTWDEATNLVARLDR